jgi:glycosyltransferase involved in cell wall biosynthesis
MFWRFAALENPKVSIIIPTYKPNGYLFECLSSIKDQILQKELFEIIIVLNGEKNPYYDNIKEYIHINLQEYFVFFIYIEEKGVSNARNIGIENSRGKYICFIDDDDIISKNYLKEMYDIAINNITPLSYIKTFKENIVENNNCYITELYERNINKKIHISNTRSFFSVLYCKLIEKSIINDNKFDKRFQNCEDSLFMFALSNKIRDLKFTDRTAIYYHRIRDNSLTYNNTRLNYRLKNNLKMIIAYIMIYLKRPFEYSFVFFISRIMASLRNIFKNDN